MKLPTFALLLALILAVVLLTNALARPESDFDLWWHVIASGGGNSTSSGFAAIGTIGQPIIGTSGGGDYRIAAGYWYGEAAPAPPPAYHFYLPNILRVPP